MSLVLLVGLVTLGLSVAMAGAFVLQARTGNGGYVDAVWSFALGGAGLAYALCPPVGGVVGPRGWLVAGLCAFWAVRLGSYMARRAARGPEDSRYAYFRREWGAAFGRRMAVFLQIQALAAALLALAMLAASRNPAPLSAQDGLGVALFVAGLGGGAIADRQLAQFRADPANRGRICERGLWGYSRHPNYFFEFVTWLAYPVLAIAPHYPPGWLALVGPGFIYYLLVHVSGIPPLEAQMLRSRGAAYAAYQRRTSAFLPLPKGPGA